MALYSMSFSDVTPNEITVTLADPIKAIVCTATDGIKISEIYIAGGETSSVVTKLVVNRPSVGGSYLADPANTQVPEKLNPYSQSASGPAFYGDASDTVGTTGANRPTFSDNDVLNLTLNAFAGVVRWVAPPGSEIIALGTGLPGEITFGGSRAGTGLVDGHLIFEQV